VVKYFRIQGKEGRSFVFAGEAKENGRHMIKKDGGAIWQIVRI
jgi:hypothetical protein